MTTALPTRTKDALARITLAHPEAIDDLRDLYADDVRFQDPIQTLEGLEAFLAMNRRLLGRARELRFDIHSVTGDDTEFFLAWTMTFAAKLGPRMAVDGTTHARARRGRIVHHRDYWDLGELIASAIPGGRAALRLALSPFA
jgi:limonene-1,2-epoxide hydrolase